MAINTTTPTQPEGIIRLNIGSLNERNYNSSNSTEEKRCLDETDILNSNDCRFIVEVYIVGVLCFIGFIGNLLTIAVLRREIEKQNVTNWLLQMLSVFDFTFLLLAFLFQTIQSLVLSTITWPQMRGQFRRVIINLWPLIGTAHFLTIWTIVLITVDRYLAICRPMQVKWRRLSFMKIIVLAMTIASLLFNIPLYFQLEIVSWKRDGVFEEIMICVADFFSDPFYQYLYISAYGLIFHSLGPFIILLILNICIILELKALNQKRREITSGMKEERNISVMFIVVVIVFVICQIPSAIIEVTYKTGVYFPVDLNSRFLRCVNAISEALLVLNSSINFLLYCLIWKKFNRILISLMKCSEIENDIYKS